MKKKKVLKYCILFLIICTLITGAVPLFSAEVSQKQDIAIFGLTSSVKNVPPRVLEYTYSSINHVFIKLKRFNVLGYGDYRLESGEIGDFIQRIRELQAQKAEEAGTYDEKFGTVVIRGEDFDRIVSSFLVVIPKLANYNVIVKREVVQEGFRRVVYKSYEAELVIDIAFVNVKEGKQEESIRISGSGADADRERAVTRAVDSAISSLSYNIRQVDMFKIKSGVVRVKGDTVFFELGANIGVRPGDEYQVMTKTEVASTGRYTELPTGLVRVKKVYPDITESKIVFQQERITEGDQLVEVAKNGIQLSFFTGVMKVDIPDMNYDIFLVGDIYEPPLSSYWYVSLDQPARNFAPLAGLTFEKSLGYRFKAVVDLTALLNFPLIGGIGEAGVGAMFHKRRITVDLAAQAGFLYMTTFRRSLVQNGLSPVLLVEGEKIDFNQDPVMNIYGVAGGLKGSSTLTYLIKPAFALRAGLGYRLYTPIKNWRIHIEETAGGSKNSVDIRGDSPNIIENEQSGGLKEVRISGYEINVAVVLRF